ncbi:MAG: ABC transporter ATP-binding protein [Lachnospiraceae bacterium]|nr:ABC transporter ATP-binding protein [Lachnospiraceae bacterium]
MSNIILNCQDVSFSYHSLTGETIALSHIDFFVKEGEFLAIVGPSGCGKSTLLSIIAKLIEPELGAINLVNKATKIGYMLQHDNLLEWRTIYKNVLLGPEINRTLTSEKEEYALKLLNDYGLYRFRNMKPAELSGGMKQRAALIRTMMMDPELLLLDEPFSALDYQTRLLVSADIGDIIKQSKKTAILVTHDLSEAISLADRIIVLSNRPATIKKILEIKLTKLEEGPLAARNAPEFKDYFTQLWKEFSE